MADYPQWITVDGERFLVQSAAADADVRADSKRVVRLEARVITPHTIGSIEDAIALTNLTGHDYASAYVKDKP